MKAEVVSAEVVQLRVLVVLYGIVVGKAQNAPALIIGGGGRGGATALQTPLD
jgi:hypothetical protein